MRYKSVRNRRYKKRQMKTGAIKTDQNRDALFALKRIYFIIVSRENASVCMKNIMYSKTSIKEIRHIC